MNLRNFLTLAAIITFLVGLRLLLAPVSFTKSFGLGTDVILLVFVRAIGALQIGIAVINWYARQDVTSPVIKGVVIGNITYHLLTLAVYGLAMSKHTITNGFSVLFELFIQVFFIVGFAYFWQARKKSVYAK